MRQIITEQQSLFSRIWFSIECTPGDLAPQVADWRNICASLAERDARRVVQMNITPAALKIFNQDLGPLERARDRFTWG